MDSSRHVRNASMSNTASAAKRVKMRIIGTTAPGAEELTSPISKYKHWKLLYASNQPENPDGTASSAEGSASTSDEDERDSSRYKGLCRNCKKRDSCRLPKPEGGVWRCEDYE
jgi:hypothetical protein